MMYADMPKLAPDKKVHTGNGKARMLKSFYWEKHHWAKEFRECWICFKGVHNM